MNVIKRILGSTKVIDSAVKGIDNIFFTNEEKAESFKGILRAYEPFKIAQRLIALMVIGTYLIVFLISVVIMILSTWFDVEEIGKEISQYNSDTLGLSVSIIVGFYFAGGAIEGIIKKRKNSN